MPIETREQGKAIVKMVSAITKFCSIAVLAFIVITALGVANWQPRTSFGWQIDHIAGSALLGPGYWRSGTLLMVFAVLLRALHSASNLMAGTYGASGAMAAALVIESIVRVRARSGHLAPPDLFLISVGGQLWQNEPNVRRARK